MCFPPGAFYNDEIREGGTGWVCSMHGDDKRIIARRSEEKNTLGYLGIEFYCSFYNAVSI
jgi:hypothetical protein